MRQITCDYGNTSFTAIWKRVVLTFHEPSLQLECEPGSILGSMGRDNWTARGWCVAV